MFSVFARSKRNAYGVNSFSDDFQREGRAVFVLSRSVHFAKNNKKKKSNVDQFSCFIIKNSNAYQWQRVLLATKMQNTTKFVVLRVSAYVMIMLYFCLRTGSGSLPFTLHQPLFAQIE